MSRTRFKATLQNNETTAELDMAMAMDSSELELSQLESNELETEIAFLQEDEGELKNEFTAFINACDDIATIAKFDPTFSESKGAIAAAEALINTSAGVESVTLQAGTSANITLQLGEAVKDGIKRMIDWFVKIYHKVTRAIFKFFQKNLGFIASKTRKIAKLRARIEKMNDYIIDPNQKKFDVASTMGYIHDGNICTTPALYNAALENTSVITNAISKVIKGLKPNVKDLPSLVNDLDLEASDNVATVNGSATELNAELTTQFAPADFGNTSNGEATALEGFTIHRASRKMLGHKTLFSKFQVGHASSVRYFLAPSTVAFPTAGKKTEVDTFQASNCVETLDITSRILTNMTELMNGDSLYDIRKSLDKAVEATKKLSTRAGKSEDASAAHLTASAVTDLVDCVKANTITLSMHMVVQARSNVVGALATVSKSLSCHIKASNA